MCARPCCRRTLCWRLQLAAEQKQEKQEKQALGLQLSKLLAGHLSASAKVFVLFCLLFDVFV